MELEIEYLNELKTERDNSDASSMTEEEVKDLGDRLGAQNKVVQALRVEISSIQKANRASQKTLDERTAEEAKAD